MHIQDDKDGKLPDTETTVEAGDPTESIEIDVGADDGDGGESKAAAGEPEKPKKTGKGRLQRKIDHERALRGEAETTAQRLARENEELRQKLTETSEKAETADRAALANYEESVKANLANAKREMIDAQSSGDAQKIADATETLGKWSAEAGRLEQWKRANPEPAAGDTADDEDEKPAPKPQRPQGQQPQLTAEAKQFLDDNPWFTPGTKDNPNPDFDLEMHQFARAHGAVLEQRYRRQGKAIDQAYWDQLAADTKAEFDYDEDGEEPKPAPKRAVPKMNGDATVTPARGGQGAPGADGQQRQGTRIVLNPEQRQMARAMVDGGAYKKPDGTPLTYQEAEVRYAKAIYRDQQQRKGA